LRLSFPQVPCSVIPRFAFFVYVADETFSFLHPCLHSPSVNPFKKISFPI
jgi:hypothetical protein